VLTLKTPYRDGTTHIVMSPLEFMQRLAALVPRPRLHLIRFHGVLAPHECHPFIGDGGAGNVAAQMLKLLALIGGAAYLGMETEAVLVDTALWRGLHRLGGDGLEAQHLLPRPGPQRDAIGAGRRLQGYQGAFRVGLGQVDHPLLFNEVALVRQ
jgi:hypothetical protein